MRILVTGGLAFIGSAFGRHLVDEGHEVLLLDRLDEGASLSALRRIGQEPRCHFANTDLRDRHALDWLFDAFRPDGVVHIATGAVRGSERGDTGQADVVGTAVLLEAALTFWTKLSPRERDDFRFVQVAADDAVADVLQGAPRPDAGLIETAARVAADHIAGAWLQAYGLPVVFASTANVYGPYQPPAAMVPRTIRDALEGRCIAIGGDGGNQRDWVYVDDYARALSVILMQGSPGERYRVTGEDGRSDAEVVRSICSHLYELRPGPEPYHSLITFVMDRPSLATRAPPAGGRLQSALDWRARETFEGGIEKTVRWYLANEAWWRPVRGRARRERGAAWLPQGVAAPR